MGTGLLLLLLAIGQGPALLWRLGEPDDDYREFALVGRYAEYPRRFPQDVVFRMGQSEPGRDWPFIHPGPADAWAGHRQHPFRILFPLDKVPPGACRLTLDLVNTHSSLPPRLEVNINERRRYRFRLPPGGPDASLQDPKAGRAFVLSFPFPAEHLRAGENAITLTVLEGSWLLYDALWLEGGLAMPQGPEVLNLSAETTMLFRRVEGMLRQAVRVRLNNVGVEGEAEAVLEGMGEQRERVSLEPGENTFHLFIPPLEKPQRLRLSMRATGKEWAVEFEGRPERRWKVFVAPSSHTDIGYTDWQERVFERHNENTALALKACQEEPTFKWNLEVAFQAFLFGRHHPRAFEQELVARLREGRIGLTGLYLNMLTGLCSGEEMVQGVSRAQRLARSWGLGPVVAANLTDVPTAVGTLPMFLRQAGVRYFAEAVNQHRAPVFRDADPRLVHSPFWWEGLDGSRVLAILTHGYGYVRRLNLTGSLEEIEERLLPWLRGFDRQGYPCDAVYAYGGFSDNERLDSRYGEAVRRWNEQWAYPQVILARVDEFFRDVEERFGEGLPVFRGDFGVYWEDGAASSAQETALVRWAKARLEAAERWLALVRLHRPQQPFPIGSLQDAWEEVLFFDEHTWGAWCSISQPESEQTKHQWAFKAAYAQRAAEKAENLGRRAREGLSALLKPAPVHLPSPNRGVVVWNEFSWPRDVMAEIPLPDASRPWRVREAGTGRLLPVQSSKGRLLFLAEQVPPLGYRSYLLEPAEPPPAPPLLRPGKEEGTWESDDFRVGLDPRTGAVSHLEDIPLGREWVNPKSPYGLNEFLYILGGEGSRLIHPHFAEPKFQVLAPAEARWRLVENGPLRAVLHIERRGQGLPSLETWLILRRDRRLEFLNLLHKEATTAKEAGYFAFPFWFMEPQAVKGVVELPYGILRVEEEQVSGGCREWYATHSFVALSDGVVTAYLATPHAPLLTFNDFFQGLWRGRLEGLNGSLFAYAFNNYWDTNYKASQGGDLLFGFVLAFRAGGFDPVWATRFGWECLAEMEDPRRGREEEAKSEIGVWEAPLPEPSEGSLLRVVSPWNAVLVGGLSWDEERLLVRLYNPGWKGARATVLLPVGVFREAWRADLVGRPQERLPLQAGRVEVYVPQRKMVTVALR